MAVSTFIDDDGIGSRGCELGIVGMNHGRNNLRALQMVPVELVRIDILDSSEIT